MGPSPCPSYYARPPAHAARLWEINKSYEARDTCLKQQAVADGTAGVDPATLAHAAALTCRGETDRLIAAANADGDRKVTASIRQDTEFRTLKYVLQARGSAISQQASSEPSTASRRE
jgi:hypothetical protein